jgi:hypothetical protein
MRRRLATLCAVIGLIVVIPATAASAASSPRSLPGPAVNALEYFESSWAGGTRVFDRYLKATAPTVLEAAPLPADSGIGRRIVYDLTDQMVWLVDADETILANYLVSGRAGWPVPGTYSVFSKSPRTTAFLGNGITMRWMVRFAKTDKTNIGFHDLPRYADGRTMQTEDELGTALSGGCVRQKYSDAVRMYRWADVGTTVVVTP